MGARGLRVTEGLSLCASTAALLIGALAAPVAARAENLDDLQRLSIDQLANVDVSSVTKTSEAISSAPGAIYVITHDEIVRSGMTSIPEILRLAPNLLVQQTGPSQYVITARGFSGNSAAQSFSNKLLVLIDGRSVYSPLYSGVYWDVQAVLPEDIDRIEVISGPGAALWGANAVNGVVNIITRKSGDTQGGLIQVGGGGFEQTVNFRYGGRLSDDLTYRIYAMDDRDLDTPSGNGTRLDDGWTKPQAGFRMDWDPGQQDDVVLQGDAYHGVESNPGSAATELSGGDLLTRWSHSWEGGASLQVQAYFDTTERATEDDGGKLTLNTFDVDIQHSFALGDRNALVWGGGVRINQYALFGPPQFLFYPQTGSLNLGDVFVQDTISLTKTLDLILGVKLEDDPYSGLATLPNARLSWRPTSHIMFWTAASKAIRAPTPFDESVVEKIGSITYLTGNPDFEAERVIAYELGARAEFSSRFTLSISAYDNQYADLRTVDPTPGLFIPLTWGNQLKGETDGVETWADLQLTSWWRISASYTWEAEHLSFVPGASGLLGVLQNGDDPADQASLKSSMDLGNRVTLDADLRHVAALPNPSVPAYTELNARLGWEIVRHLQLSVVGANLLNPEHMEAPAPAIPVPRSVYAELQWRF